MASALTDRQAQTLDTALRILLKDAGWIASGVVNGVLDEQFDSGGGLHGNDAARHLFGSSIIRSFLQANSLL